MVRIARTGQGYCFAPAIACHIEKTLRPDGSPLGMSSQVVYSREKEDQKGLGQIELQPVRTRACAFEAAVWRGIWPSGSPQGGLA